MDNFYLPQAFLSRMQRLLQNEYEEFLSSYEKPRLYGLRANTLKCDLSAFPALYQDAFGKDASLLPVPWAEEGFTYDSAQPGRHPLHEAGAYYIQEPSAMSAAAVLCAQPGERVLDLCAAPGGKSTQIACRMQGEGLLVANEIVESRAKILSRNIERMGIRNAVVTNETPQRMSAFFPEFFDKILVDAPCSGEGMFKKEEAALTEWSEANVLRCQARQAEILEEAQKMLRPGGRLVYSTCTFSPEENEQTIAAFLKKHPDFTLLSSPLSVLFSEGRPDFADGNPDLKKCMRLWPQKISGEGHFVALMEKASEVSAEDSSDTASYKKKDKKNDAVRSRKKPDLTEFHITKEAEDKLYQNRRMELFNEHVYLLPEEMPDLKGLITERPGLHLGDYKKDRFEPSLALALSLRPGEVTSVMEMDTETANRYLHGETFPCDPSLSGWTLLTIGGISLGFGKASGGSMKNHYPKGLRIEIK